MQNSKEKSQSIGFAQQNSCQTLKSKTIFTRINTDNTQTILTQKMKDICLRLFQKSSQRIKKNRQEYNFRQQHNQKVMKIVGLLENLRHSKPQKYLTLRQINQLIDKYQCKIAKTVNNNIKIKKILQQRIKFLQNCRKERLQFQQQYSAYKSQNRSYSLILSYTKYLQNHCIQSQQINTLLLTKQAQKEQSIQSQKRQTKRIIDQSIKTQQMIQIKQQQHVQLYKFLEKQFVDNTALSLQKIPNQKQMINCMFLIGILNQQNLILYLKKSIKPIEKVNKIHQNLSKRQIIIDCQNSQIIQLKIITAVYMHCKSLLLNNIVHLMKTMSFFSDQLRHIYSYKSFEKYLIVLIEKMKLNSQWIKMKENNELLSKEIQISKKRLIIFIKSQHFNFLQQIFDVLSTNDKYQINVGTFRMMIDLKQQQQDNKQADNLTLQSNQLTLKLHKYPINIDR